MNANLVNANLEKTNLKHTDFNGTKINGALLCDAELDMDFKLQEWTGEPILDKDCFGVCGGDMLIVKDACGVCGGNSMPNTGNCDCLGIPNGSAIIDACGVCGGAGDGNDCNNNGILDLCEDYSGDSLINSNKINPEKNILDVVKLVESIVNQKSLD